MVREKDAEATVQLLKRTRTIVASDGSSLETTSVHCPKKQHSSTLDACLKCPHLVRHTTSNGHGYLECHVPAPLSAPHDTCGEWLSPAAVCLDGELDASVAADLLEQAGVSAAPVLDDNQVFVGMVSTTSLAQLRLEAAQLHGFGRQVPREVEDAMSTHAATLTEDSTVAQAAELMTSHGVDQIPVLADDGHLVGVISALDLVRWLHRRLSNN